MSSEEIINYEILTRKNKNIKEKEYQKKEKNNEVKERQIQQKIPQSIIYQDGNQRDIELTDDNGNENAKQEQDQNTQKAKEITNYYLELHKDMINTYNSIYSQLLQNISNYSSDDITILKRFMDYPFDNKNMYINSISSSRINSDESLKLIDNVMTKNIDTFIKSIKLTQKFYKGIIENYLNCIKK